MGRSSCLLKNKMPPSARGDGRIWLKPMELKLEREYDGHGHLVQGDGALQRGRRPGNTMPAAASGRPGCGGKHQAGLQRPGDAHLSGSTCLLSLPPRSGAELVGHELEQVQRAADRTRGPRAIDYLQACARSGAAPSASPMVSLAHCSDHRVEGANSRSLI